MMKRFLSLVAVGVVVAVTACSSSSGDDTAADDANVVKVDVGGVNGDQFSPAEVTVKVGQRVRWTFLGGVHNVVSGTDCTKLTGDGKFYSGEAPSSGTFEHLFDTAGDFPYFCVTHCQMNMKGIVHVTP